MSVELSTWSVRRDYPHPVARVFGAWAVAAVKRRWFDLSEPGGSYASDFRVGGVETYRSGPGASPRYAYDGCYHDIVPDVRIVTAYRVTANGRRVSVSLAVAEFTSTTSGARLDLTEQGAYLDGLDTARSRRAGTQDQLEALSRALRN